MSQLQQLGIKPIALSADKEADAAALAEILHLRYPVCYGLDAPAVAARVGAYVNLDPPYFQPTTFVLGPDGRVSLAVYASSNVGCLPAQSVIELVRDATSAKKSA